MGYNASGIWTTDFSPAEEAQQTAPFNYVQSGSQQDFLDSDVKTGFDLCFLRDGRTEATGNFNLGGYRVTNIASPLADSDAVRYDTFKGLEDSVTELDNLKVDKDFSNYQEETTLTTVDNFLLDNERRITSLNLANALPLRFADGYIKGLLPANGVDPLNNISIGIGKARSADNLADIELTTPIEKELDTNWAEGTLQGGLFTGTATADETYHMFVIQGESSPATSGTFTTIDISGNFSNFQSVTNGSLTYSIDDGALTTISNLNFTTVTNLEDIARLLDLSISGCMVENIGNTIKFTSNSTGVISEVKLFANSIGTDLYGSSYLDGINGVSVIGTDFEPAPVDAGFDTDINCSNIPAGYIYYRRIASFKVDANAEFLEFKTQDLSGGGIRILYNSDILVRSGTTNSLLSVPVPSGVKINPVIYAYGYIIQNQSTKEWYIGSNEDGSAINRILYLVATVASYYSCAANTFENYYTTDGSMYFNISGNTAVIQCQGYIDQRI